jgi:ABC-2 type transport system permease protein
MRQFLGSITLTFRELWAMKITMGLSIVTTIAWIMLSFALSLDVVEGSLAAVRILGFEDAPTEMVRDAETGKIVRDDDGDRLTQALSLDNFVLGINDFVFSLSYIFGTLIGLFATVPLVSGFLEPGRIDLLLSKPISRNKLLWGHLVGVWAVVFLLSTYLIGAVWLVISFKTGLWQYHLLLAIPTITVMFAVIFSIVITVSIASRSAGLSLVLAYGAIFVSAVLAAKDQIVPQLSDLWSAVFVSLYHILPNYFEVMSSMLQLASDGSVTSAYPLISSILFGVVIYAIGFVVFNRRDF